MHQFSVFHNYPGDGVFRSLLLAALMSLHSIDHGLASGPTLQWIHQLGTPLINEAGVDGEGIAGISLDGLGSLYFAGGTFGNLGGQNGGGSDAFLGKFAVNGNQQWIHQFGGTSNQGSSSVSADALGNVFLAGMYTSPIGSGSISNYNGMGNEVWSRQGVLGADISADGVGNVYAAGTIDGGTTEDDGILIKHNSAGDQLWSRQFGTGDYDQQFRVSADSAGNVYPFGNSVVSGTKVRVILSKFDSDGNEGWTRLLESARYVQTGDVVADGLGNVYICGHSNAPIAEPRIHPGYDAFVAKYDAQGNRLWINEFGTTDANDHSRGITIDGLGNVYVAGNTDGNLGGQSVGGYDAFLAKFDINGNHVWIHQFGTTTGDSLNHVVADGFGNVYVAGSTKGDLAATYSGGGGDDVFVARFSDPVPEPNSFFLLLGCAPWFRRTPGSPLR
jgi:hypothetical protein